MANKKNPLGLNALQLRTLTILQAIAQIPEAVEAGPGTGEITILRFPQVHADHFHLGDRIVMRADASGLFNQAVWNALTRKGLARADWPNGITLTAGGLGYDTGPVGEILRQTAH